MSVWNEDEAQRVAGGFTAAVTGAVGSNASIDLKNDLGRDVPQNVEVDDAAALELAKALKQVHPDYARNEAKWRKYLNLYMSNDIYSFIHRHLREVDIKYEQRVERGYYFNYVKSVVDLFTAFLFHHPIDRNVGEQHSEFFKTVYKDADLSGTLWNVFMQRVCTFAQVEGHVGILVDAPQAPEGGFASEAERQESGARPFLSLIHSLQIRDWEVDQHGNFTWVKLEIFRPMEREWNQPSDARDRNFVIWTKTEWQEYVLHTNNTDSTQEDTAELVGQGNHKLKRVPLVIVKTEDHPLHPWFGLSSVKDIGDINIAILNWSSLLDEEIFERCLNILAMERGEGDAPLELSHANILEYDSNTQKPDYLTPGQTPIEMIIKAITVLRDEIRRLAKVSIGGGVADIRQASSGIAKAFAFLETNQSLSAKSLSMEQAETEVHRLMLEWENQTFEGNIEYPREFGVEDQLTLFQEMDMARSSLTSETAIKEKEKSLVRKLHADKPQDLREQMEREIDEADMKMDAINSGALGPLGPIPPGLTDEGSPGTEGDDGASSQNPPDAGNGNRTRSPSAATAA